MVANSGLTPNNIIFNEEGDILVSGPAGVPGVPNRGKGLTLGPAGYVLASNGMDPVWVPYSLSPGTVSSISAVAGAGITISGSPITNIGTLNIGLLYPTLIQNTGNVTGTIDVAAGSFSLNAPIASGTVSSVGISSTGGDLSITSSPITSSGIIDVELSSQTGVAGTWNLPTITVNSKGIITNVAAGTFSTNQIVGNLSLSNFNDGLNASATTFWSGTGGPGGAGAWLSVIGSATPQNLGIASAGTSTLASAQDHVHHLPTPNDIGALATVGGTITGNLAVNGTITGTISGNATNITATSNSTLVTLSSLLLPYSQLIGTIPTWNQNTTGTAANVTATSNSTLTTLSSLSLPYSQLSGSVPTWNQDTTGTAAHVITNANLTGDVTSVGNATTIVNLPAISGAALTNLTAANISSGTANINISGNAATATTTTTNANLTGDVTSVGNATTLVATSNSTLTTLSALASAPSLSVNYTQLTGVIPTWNQDTTGTAAKVITNANLTGDVTSMGNNTNIVATSNNTLTTLSSLVLPFTQLSGAATTSQIPSATTILDTIGANQGDILYRNGSTWTVLAPGTFGQFLQTQGAASPQWATLPNNIDSYTLQTAGTTYTVGSESTVVIDGPTTFTVTMPASPIDGQVIAFSTGNTSISSFSVIGNGSQTVNGSPTSLSMNTGVGFIYVLSNTTWYRKW